MWKVGLVVSLLFSLAVGLLLGHVATRLVDGMGMLPLWVDMLLLFGVAGGFGGVLGALQVTDVAKLLGSSDGTHWSPNRARNVALALVISAVGGMGGASAALLVMALDERIKSPPSDVNRLAYIGLAVAAGFLGFKLLGKIAEQVGDWLRIQKEVADSAALERRRTDTLIAAITKGMAAQRPTAEAAQVESAIAELKRALAEFPDNRTAAMILGWLYANKQNNPTEALLVLDSALRAMKQAGAENQGNRADILYNCACYHYRIFEAAASADKPRHLEDMYQALQESIRLKPENKKVARDEPTDFRSVKTEARFVSITGA